MRIAIFTDIHSNIYALEAVYEDVKKRNVDLSVCLGDLVGYCTFPNEVIGFLRDRNILTIMGNYDEAVGEELMACGCDYPDPKDMENASASLNWTIDETTEDNKRYLRSLPRQASLLIEGKQVVLTHGSPRKINEYLKENTNEAEEVMEGFEGDVLICGHTHKPYYKYYGGKLLINAGSAGKPKTGVPKANYLVVDIDKNDIKVDIYAVDYDYEKTAKAIEDAGLPLEFAELIRTGKA